MEFTIASFNYPAVSQLDLQSSNISATITKVPDWLSRAMQPLYFKLLYKQLAQNIHSGGTANNMHR